MRESGIASSMPTIWQPLSLTELMARPDYAGFVLVVVWIAATALCVWWALVGASFGWNLWTLHLGGLRLDFGLFLPWCICVLLVMWLGLEWAAVPAYLATLFGSLHIGLSADIAVVNSLHNPLAMAMYFLFYCGFSQSYDLRSVRAWLVFIGASLAAALVSSIGSFIMPGENTPIGLLESWLGWWPNAFAESLLVAPLIFLFSPWVERVKRRHYKHVPKQAFSWQQLLLAISMFVLSLALFVLLNDHWLQARSEMILSLPLEQAHLEIRAQFMVQRVVIWTLAVLLAGISLGGVVAMSRLVRRMNERSENATRQAQSELHRSEAKFRHYFERNPAPMWVYERGNGRFVEVNRAAIERYGYSRDEFLSMTLYDIRPPEDRARLEQQMHAKHGDPSFREAGDWRHRCKDGSLMDVEVHISPAEMAGVDASLALIHDVTPHMQAQRLNEKRARELQVLAAVSLEIISGLERKVVLQRVAARARQLIDAALVIIRDWPVTTENTSAVGVALAEPTSAWQYWVAPLLDDSDRIAHQVAEKLYPIRYNHEQLLTQIGGLSASGGESRAMPFRSMLALPLMGQDAGMSGVLQAFSVHAEGVSLEDEALLMQLAQIAAIGLENVRLHEALQAHMQALEQRVAERTAELDTSNRELDAFAYSVAHDLRAPLRAIHGFADAVLEDYGASLEAAGQDYLRRVVKAARSMDTLIQDLLAFSRVGRGEMDLQKVRLDEVVQEAVHDLEHEIASRHGQIEVRVPSLTVLAHPSTLRQVVLNLVGNALKFVAAGQTPEVRVTAVSDGDQVELRVRDNGIGIAPEHRERIFNVFERLHGAESYPGTGIGLSIVKKAVVRMRGEIKVDSNPGSGSTFRVILREYKNE